MTTTPRVYLLKRPNSKVWYMRWKDHTGKEFRQSTGTVKRSDARQVAFEKENEFKLKARADFCGWGTFRERYETEVLAGKSEKHQAKWKNAANKLESLFNPILVTDIDSEKIGEFARKLRVSRSQKDTRPLSETTIDSYLGYLKRALAWAAKANLIDSAPHIERSIIAIEDSAKGRPLTDDEFRRMIEAIPKVVGASQVESIKHMLHGLYHSGLRFGEAMNLHWPGVDIQDDKILVVIESDSVTLSIPGKMQKRRRRQIYPVVPEFAKFLRQTPAYKRIGFVFNPLRQDGKRFIDTYVVSRLLANVGEAAGIVVKRLESGSIKYASAQDLRRTFGLRWAKRVNSLTLKNLMRHSNIRTTETYYAISDAVEMAKELEERFGEK